MIYFSRDRNVSKYSPDVLKPPVFRVVNPVELEESLGDLEHFPAPEDVEVERQTLVLFVID